MLSIMEILQHIPTSLPSVVRKDFLFREFRLGRVKQTEGGQLETYDAAVLINLSR